MASSQKRKLTAMLIPAEEGGFIVKCLEVPVASQGETRAEALKNIKEAIELYLEEKADQIKDEKGERVNVIVKTPPTFLA